ncbi:Uncharacterised protein [Mesomycoplasma dispar]|uniref:Mycoplasma lipoprotein C-terminal domain-containing protein n=1 Tax=Mesomycoplasma dispar TaxID=86660 RepID=A0AAJ5TCN7_9BACT|nr:lipoprotein [Mesomycoplasma dispar]AJR12182.1 lipoprotein [Mesomycoplasma dispar]VEU61740.1 Uncharacterised protein [Mesomycoplasma dispar]
MKLKKIFKTFALLSPSFLLVAAACGANQEEKKPTENGSEKTIDLTKIDPKTQVVLTTSQGSSWPLIFGLNVYGKNEKGLIPYYNQKFKNDADFAPVRIVLNDEAKVKTQSQTTQNIKNLLDSNSDQIPSLVLGDSSTASVLEQYNRLLDVRNDKLKPELFANKLVSAYNDTDFAKNNKFYNIPFNNNDVDALGFNLDNLKIILDLIKKGGGSVDESMEVYKKAVESETKGNSTPENSFFKALEVKNDQVFKDLKVTMSTFSNIEEALEFATKFIDGLKIKENSKIDQNTDNASIFAIDYSGLILHKNLVSKTGKSFWKSQGKDLSYPIITDESLRNEFKQSYEKFVNTNKTLEHKVGNKTKVLQAFQFKDFKGEGIGDWGSHDILRYRTVFGYIPGVGIKQSIDSATTRYLFAKDKAENAKKFTTFHDVFTTNQPLKSRSDSPYSVFAAGGSSLIPIRTDSEKINKATIKFLEWLYTGQNDIDGKMVDNVDYLMENTGYFVPTKEILTEKKLEEVKAKYQEYFDKIVDFETKNKKSYELINKDDVKKIDWSLYEKMANLRSVIISMESMLKALKEQGDKLKILTDNGNFKATKISGIILDSLIQSTRVENKKTTSADDILKLISEQN